MTGKIVKGIAGFYYVHVVDGRVYECKAKGIFRNQNIKPLVGDNVSIEVLDEENKKGNIIKICRRDNELIRPAVANIDQVLIIFALTEPQPNLNLLDRFLVMMEYQNIDISICFNKTDIGDADSRHELREIYNNAGYNVIFTSTFENDGIDVVSELLENKTTVFAGPSGVGKSSMLNTIIPDINLKTGEVSKKIGRGRHTTRHSEIFNVSGSTYIMDTPGFSSIFIPQIDETNLKYCFPEFLQYEGKCRFNGCVHVNEPDCKIKEAVEDGKISRTRYDNYLMFYDEIKNRKKF